jgi:hypothetical protein
MAQGRLALVILVGVLLAATLSPAEAAPKEDSVTGGGRDSTGAEVSISARSGPAGDDARGHINATTPQGLRTRLDVLCLATETVAGVGLASIGAVITQSSDPSLVGAPVVVTVRDGGIGTEDGLGLFFGEPPQTCPLRLAVAASSPPLESGNLKVEDAG